MKYKIEVKPFIKKDGINYKIIQITDITLHTSEKTPTVLAGKKIQKAFKNNIPGRIYATIENGTISKNRNLTLDLLKNDPDFIRMIQEEESKGYKVLIALPNEGIPLLAGSDTVEFINSKNGRRIIRGLAKETDKQ